MHSLTPSDKALAAREANFDEPIPDDRITDVAAQIGLEGDEFDSALDYAADQGWFEDAEVGDSASWVSLTPAWCGRCEILIARDVVTRRANCAPSPASSP